MAFQAGGSAPTANAAGVGLPDELAGEATLESLAEQVRQLTGMLAEAKQQAAALPAASSGSASAETGRGPGCPRCLRHGIAG